MLSFKKNRSKKGFMRSIEDKYARYFLPKHFSSSMFAPSKENSFTQFTANVYHIFCLFLSIRDGLRWTDRSHLPRYLILSHLTKIYWSTQGSNNSQSKKTLPPLTKKFFSLFHSRFNETMFNNFCPSLISIVFRHFDNLNADCLDSVIKDFELDRFKAKVYCEGEVGLRILNLGSK